MMMWICGVCGYEHEGTEPPATCPVCGVDASHFSNAAGEPAPPAAAQAGDASTWLCAVCGYEQHGAEAPASCPVCGADASAFSSSSAPAAPPPADAFSGQVVIIGAGIAGISAAEAAARQAPACRITVLNGEDEAPYARINLTRFLAGEMAAADLPLHDATWYADHGIALRKGCVTHIDRDARRLRLASGEELPPYDRLIIASGSRPVPPPLPGLTLPAVHCLRTRADAQQLLDETRAGDPVVVIGGGVLGLECAGALARQGRQVTVCERGAHLMSRQLDAAGAQRLAAALEAIGITLRFAVSCSGIVATETGLLVQLDAEPALPACRVVFSIGVQPDDTLAAEAGLHCERGIVVDDQLRSSDPAIWAAGDCCRHRGRSYGLWTAATFQGAIAGANAVGGETAFLGLEPSVQLKVLGLPVAGIGAVQATADDQELCDENSERYRRLLLRAGRLRGAVLVGDTSAAAPLARAIEDGTSLSGASVEAVLSALT